MGLHASLHQEIKIPPTRKARIGVLFWSVLAGLLTYGMMKGSLASPGSGPTKAEAEMIPGMILMLLSPVAFITCLLSMLYTFARRAFLSKPWLALGVAPLCLLVPVFLYTLW